MMAERLAVSEAKLMKMHQDEASAEELKNLVAIKMELAESRFEALELQVRPLGWLSVYCGNKHVMKVLSKGQQMWQARVYRQGKYQIVTSESTPPFRLLQQTSGGGLPSCMDLLWCLRNIVAPGKSGFCVLAKQAKLFQGL